jgi:four helix bundle protein
VINSFKDLIVWQKSMELVEKVYKITESFPTKEQFGLISQMRRAAVSIPSNIAEGYGRNSTGSYIQFLSIARGSLLELETQLELSKRLNFINKL